MDVVFEMCSTWSWDETDVSRGDADTLCHVSCNEGILKGAAFVRSTFVAVIDVFVSG